MKKTLSIVLLSLAIGLPAVAAGLGELFQKAKEQVKSARWKEAMTTLDALDAASRDPGLEAQRKQLEPALAFYRAVSMANLDQAAEAQAQFQIYLTATPNASLDRGMYTKKTMDAFEAARKSMNPSENAEPGLPSLAKSYRDFKPGDAAMTDPPRETWAEGPARVLLTSNDKRQWDGLMDPASRSEFITKFWAARDPKPETPENEFRQEFEKRTAFADRNFVQGETRGSLTDRGMVFILLGPPTYIGRKPLSTGDDTADSQGMSSTGRHDAEIAIANATQNSSSRRLSSGTQSAIASQTSGSSARDASDNWREVWHYRRELLPSGVPYHQVDFDFITRKGYGTNVLQRDSPVLATLDAAKRGTRPSAWRNS